MLATRTEKRQYSLVEYAKVRVRSRLNKKGISVEKMDMDAVETAIIEEVREITEIEMVDAEIDNIIKQGLSDSRRAQTITGRVSTGDFMEVNKETSQKSIEILPSPERHAKAGSKQAISEAAPLKQMDKNTGFRIDASLSEKDISNISDRKADPVDVFEVPRNSIIPEEFVALIEAKKIRAANVAENIEISSTAVGAAEASLASKLLGRKKSM